MIRIADYIAKELAKYSEIVYMVTGGGAMHLNDAFSKSGMNTVFCHHEQSCSIAAESYSKITRKLSVVNVTTGPGGINALNGVFGAYIDSIPMIIISGQVKRETIVSTYGNNNMWRQLGHQEVDIVNMVSGITKYAFLIQDPKSIKYHLNKAIVLALTGRQGPCWIDVPIDIQSMMINENELDDYLSDFSINTPLINTDIYEKIVSLIFKSKRPVFYIGSGIHNSNTINLFFELAEITGIPIVTAWNSNDLIPDDHPQYVGRPGTIGNRTGNFVVQNSDLLIVLGSRLHILQVSYNWKSFAPRAIKIGVDIDNSELNKPTCNFDYKINQDLAEFIPNLLKLLKKSSLKFNFTDWLKWGKDRLIKYPVCLPEYWNITKNVNPYCFIDELSNYSKEGEIIICGNGTACVVTFQGIKVKSNQRIFHNAGCQSMGYDLPAVIGAFNSKMFKDRIICITGDGSIMMNLQELQTISGMNIPVQIFILNNEGYHSIRQTQNNYFKDNIIGCGVDSGLTFPNFKKIANAFDLKYFSISNHTELKNSLNNIMNNNSFICEVKIDLNQEFSPKLVSKMQIDGSMITPPLEDMWPFLSKEELQNNIIN
jgi:acetolactate synthase-1/2/3 large subunit